MSSPSAPVQAPAKASLGRLLSLAWPIILSRSSQVVVGVTDAVMVAGLGEAALAATGTGALNAFNLLILPMGVVFIVSTYSSQLAGKGDARGARRYGHYGLLIALAAQVLCLVSMPFLPSAIQLFGYPPEISTLLISYMTARLWTGGAAIGMEALANYYGGLGNTRLPMLANVFAMALNVLLNWILIRGHLGAPALGVTGAALASAFSTLIAFLGLGFCFVRGIGTSGRWIAGLAHADRVVIRRDLPLVKLSWGEFSSMLKVGLPSGFNWFFEYTAYSFFINVVVAALGTTALAALIAVMQINAVSFMPAFGLASAGAILVGQEIGMKAHDRVPGTVRLTLIVAAVWQGLAGLAYLFFPELLLRPFLGAQASVSGTSPFLDVSVRMLMLSAAWQLFDAAASTIAEALRAAGDTAFILWLRLGLAWLVFVPGVFISVKVLGQGDVAALLWFVAYLGLLAGTLALRFRNGAWRRIELTEHGALPSTVG